MQHYCPDCDAHIKRPDAESCARCGLEPPPFGWPRDELLGEVVEGGRYKVLRRIGSGGFGVVYEVQRTQANYRRAMKVLSADLTRNANIQRQFVEEAEILNGLDHPNIVRCHEVGVLPETGHLFMLLELIKGRNLFDVVWPRDAQEPSRMHPRDVATVGLQIAKALHVAHALGLLHRDLKPENILALKSTETDPDELRVKVIDFGIAKILGPDPNDKRTQNVTGTPDYMAPEQFRPGVALDARLDLYQLGGILFFCLTGWPPYEAGDNYLRVPLLQSERGNTHGPRPSEQIPALAAYGRLDTLIGDLLSTDRDRRPATAAQVVEVLEACLLDDPGDVHSTELKALGFRSPRVGATHPPAGRSVTTGGTAIEPVTQGPPNPNAPGALSTLDAPLRPQVRRSSPLRPNTQISISGAESERVKRLGLMLRVGAVAILILMAGAVYWAVQRGDADASPATPDAAETARASALEPNAGAVGSTPGGGAETGGAAGTDGAGASAAGAEDGTPQAGDPNPVPGGDAPGAGTGDPAAPDPDLMAVAAALHAPEGFVRITQGAFRMGSPANEPGRRANESTAQVELTRSFYLQKSEVTQAQWQEVMSGTPAHFTECGAQCPVERVSWFDALAYLNALSKRDGFEPCYTLDQCTEADNASAGCAGQTATCRGTFTCASVTFKGLACGGYRLPTEAEWEYAARAGDSGATYGPPKEVAWSLLNSGNSTHPVHGLKPNRWDVFDTLGNVAEWVWDGPADRASLGARDPIGPNSAEARVYRGGSWADLPTITRAAWRGTMHPATRDRRIGFRAARSLKP